MKPHLLAGAILGVLALAGCSGNDPVRSESVPQPPDARTSTQRTTQQPTQQPTHQATQVVTQDPTGSASGFCEAIASGGDVALGQWNQPASDPKLREQLIKRFAALVEAAPADVKPAMKDVAAGYELVSSGKVSGSDQATITKYATAIQKLNTWMQANCPNLKVPTPAQ